MGKKDKVNCLAPMQMLRKEKRLQDSIKDTRAWERGEKPNISEKKVPLSAMCRGKLNSSNLSPRGAQILQGPTATEVGKQMMLTAK